MDIKIILTHLQLEKQWPPFHRRPSQVHFHEWDFNHILISPKCVSKCLIDNKAALVQVMAWRRTGERPLPEPMHTQFIDTYIQHMGDELIVFTYCHCLLYEEMMQLVGQRIWFLCIRMSRPLYQFDITLPPCMKWIIIMLDQARYIDRHH